VTTDTSEVKEKFTAMTESNPICELCSVAVTEPGVWDGGGKIGSFGPGETDKSVSRFWSRECGLEKVRPFVQPDPFGEWCCSAMSGGLKYDSSVDLDLQGPVEFGLELEPASQVGVYGPIPSCGERSWGREWGRGLP
jgi:hypothetical protein